MNFLEKDLEDIIYENPDVIVEKGLESYKGILKFRQLKIGNYGIADLVTVEKPLYYNGEYPLGENFIINIHELKRGEITESTFFQAIRYARGIQRWLQIKGYTQKYDFTFKIVLVGSSFSNDSVCYLSDFFDPYDDTIWHSQCFSFQGYTYQYGLSGISFENKSSYVLINEGF